MHIKASCGWKTRNTLLRSSETVPRLVRSRRARRAARISIEVTTKRWTNWQSWRRSCASKTQASAIRQVCVERLGVMMSKPRKMGDIRPSRYLVGTQKLSLRFDHQEYGDMVRILVDSDWAGSEKRCSTHAGLGFHGGLQGCVRPGACPEFRRKQNSKESWMTLHEGSPHEAHVRRDGPNQRRHCDGFHCSNRDVLPNWRWKDKTHPSSLVVDPGRHS